MNTQHAPVRGRWPRSRGLAFAALLSWMALALLRSPTARAGLAPPAHVPSEEDPDRGVVALSILPALGQQAPASTGWTAYWVTLENLTGSNLGGTLYLTPNRGIFRESELDDAYTETPIWLSAEGKLQVEMLAWGPTAGAVDAIFVDESGKRLGKGKGESVGPQAPHWLDASGPAPATRALRGKTFATPLPTPSAPGVVPMPFPRESSIPIAVSVAPWNAADDRPELPTRAAAYSPVTVMHVSSERLMRFPKEQLAALSDWVLSGGALSLSISRVPDLSSPVVARLIGPGVVPGPTTDALLDEQPVYVPRLDAPGTASQGETQAITTLQIPNRLTKSLVGFRGGNLHPSAWGSVASYGLGQVHVLGFDPNSELFAEETWTELKLLSLLEHAERSRDAVGLPHGTQRPEQDSYFVRKFLRYNRNQHWAILGAALLLIAYSGLAGPLNFRSSRRSRRPLSALVRLCVMSALAVFAVLAIGALSRGTSERASHLTLIEAGAGMARAKATRFRAFHAASFSSLEVAQTDAGSVVGIVNPRDGVTGRSVLGPSGLHIAALSAKPWQTVLVREEGFANLHAGVSLRRTAGGELLVHNRSGRDLAAVLLQDATGERRFFSLIQDGQQVTFSQGSSSAAGRPSSSIGRGYLLDPTAETSIDDVAPGAVQGWLALEQLTEGKVDWWPHDVPTLIAQIVGGEGYLRDSGFELRSDRVLLRVVGLGGQP